MIAHCLVYALPSRTGVWMKESTVIQGTRYSQRVMMVRPSDCLGCQWKQCCLMKLAFHSSCDIECYPEGRDWGQGPSISPRNRDTGTRPSHQPQEQ